MDQLINHPFQQQAVFVQIEPGRTVMELVHEANLPQTIWPNVRIAHNSMMLSEDLWPEIVLEEDDRIEIFIVPMGSGGDSKSILRLVATIAVSIFAAWAAPAVQFWLGGSIAAAGIGTATAVIAAGLTLIGTLAINALIPPPSAKLDPNKNPEQAAQAFYLSGQQNQAQPYGVIPTIYGEVRFVPNLITQPIVESCGNRSIFSALYDFGLGYVDISNPKIGDTAVGLFAGPNAWKTYEHVPTWNSSLSSWIQPELKFITHAVAYNDVNVPLEEALDEAIVTTGQDVTEVRLEIAFPGGLAKIDKKTGNYRIRGVEFGLQYRPTGTTPWLDPIPGVEACSKPPYGTGDVPPVIENTRNFYPLMGSSAGYSPTLGYGFYKFTSPGKSLFITIQDRGDDTLFQPDSINPIQWYDENDVPFKMTLLSTTVGSWGGNRRVILEYYPDQKSTVGWVYAKIFTDQWKDGNGDVYDPPRTYYLEYHYIDASGATTKPPVGDVVPTIPRDADYYYNTTPGLETYVVMIEKLRVEGGDNLWFPDGAELWIDGIQYALEPAAEFGIRGKSEESQYFSSTVRRTLWSVNDAAFAYQSQGGGGGVAFNDSVTAFAAKLDPGTIAIVIPFPAPGQYDVKVTRVTLAGDVEFQNSDDWQAVDRATLARMINYGAMYSPNNNHIINMQTRHTLAEVRIPSSEQLSGNVQRVSAMANARIRHRVGGFWKFSYSNNPAWVALDILTGYSIQNKGIKPKNTFSDDVGWVLLAQIDILSFEQFAEYCDEVISYTEADGTPRTRPRHTFNGVVASTAPIVDTVQTVLNQCSARLILNQQGKLGVFIDQKQKVARALYTPANSWGFSANRDYIEEPDALRVKFISPELEYQESEVVVYRPGKNEGNAQVYEEVTTFGITNWHQAQTYGDYLLRQGVFRSESFSLSVEAEMLTVQVGDLVRVQHDVPLLGGESVYIKSKAGNRMTIDRAIGAFSGTVSYTHRHRNGTIYHGTVTDELDDWFEVAASEASRFSPGDLVVLGVKKPGGEVTDEYLVNAIQPQTGFTATITLSRYDERVYEPYGEFPVWDPGFGQDALEGATVYMNSLSGSSSLTHVDRMPYTRVKLAWTIAPSDANVSHFTVSWKSFLGGDPVFIEQVDGGLREYTFEYPNLTGEFGTGYFSVVPTNMLGYDGGGRQTSVNKRPDVVNPDAPSGLKAEWQYNGTTKLSWTAPNEPDIENYMIYSADTNVGTGAATLLGQVSYNTTEFVVPGIEDKWYYVIAEDTSGNRSTPAVTQSSHPIPPPVENFVLRVTGNSGVLSWDRINDPWITEYQIYFNPNEAAQNVNDLGTVLLTTAAPNASSAAVPGDLGAYFIRAKNTWNELSPATRTSTFVGDLGVSSPFVAQTMTYTDRYPFTNVVLTWAVYGPTSLIDHYEVKFTDAAGNVRDLGSTTQRRLTTRFDIVRDADANTGTFEITPISVFGSHGNSDSVQFVTLKDTTAPETPRGFFANVHGNVTIDLNWHASVSPDVDRYVLRYSPLTQGATWASAELLAETDHTTTNSTVSARTGTYLLAAYDTSGNRSDATIQRTVVEELPGLNAVEKWNDQPRNWPGQKSAMIEAGGKLLTDGTFVTLPEGGKVLTGIYTSDEFVDLGDVFEVRLISKVQAHAEITGNFIAGWPNLSGVQSLAGVNDDPGDWDVWVEYRVSDSDANMISTWPTLAGVNPIGGAGSITWSAWHRFISADVTGRFFQFRIVAQSFEENTIVVVDDGLVELDMEDRLWSEKDIQVSTAGVQIDFTPPFLGLTGVSVTIDGNAAPVVAEITNKLPTGMFVRLINSDSADPNFNQPVAGQVDVIVTGYGRLRLTSITDGGYRAVVDRYAGGWLNH